MTGKTENLDKKLLQMLKELETRSGLQIHVTSGFRTPEENRAVKGSPNSAHLRGRAADLRAPDIVTATKIVCAAIICGFRRIGIYNSHIHVDIDRELPFPAVWDFSTNRRQLHQATIILANLDKR